MKDFVEEIQKCKMCKDYDDSWTIECFCPKCKKILKEVEE